VNGTQPQLSVDATYRPLASAPERYRMADDVVDFDEPHVREQAALLVGGDDLDTARRCFLFVRDEILHSADHRRSPTTCSASSVLAAKTGYCYAKSHLLVALLRANGLAAGFCYQRLTVAGPTPPYCLHGLVAVELPRFGWYAVDARGNKPGVDAQFTPPREQLAFAVQYPGERMFAPIFATPHPAVLSCLRRFASWDAVLANLPDLVELEAW
jgi:transglutaminase-like putative cysteine protease